MQSVIPSFALSQILHLQQQASSAYSDGKYHKVLAIVDSAIELLEHQQPAPLLSNFQLNMRSLLGYVYSAKLQEHSLAGAQFRQCEEIDRFHPLLLRRRAESYAKNNLLEQALEDYRLLGAIELENGQVKNKIKQIQTLIQKHKSTKIETHKLIHQEGEEKATSNPSQTSVRFGSFEIIEINDSDHESDERQARIQKGVEGLSKSTKSTKSILKETFSGHSSTHDSVADDSKPKLFESTKIKSIQKVVKKIEDLQDIDGIEDNKIRFKKHNSMYEKKGEQDSLPPPQPPHKADTVKPTMKKSKSVAFKLEQFKD